MTREGQSSILVRFALGLLAVLLVLTLLFCWMGVGTVRAYLVSITVTTFCAYGMDKLQAVGGGWRVPEVVLHGLALFGGTVGALLGQIVFSHKTRKQSSRAIFMLIVVLQVLLLALCRWTLP